MQLKYNIHFGVASIVYMTILVIYLALGYNMNSKRNREFYKLTLFILLSAVLDVVTAVTISYAAEVPYILNMVLNAAYFVTNTVISRQFLKYSALSINKTADQDKIGIGYLIIIYGFYALIAINFFTGLLFDFSESGAYIHGPLYPLLYIMPYTCFIAGVLHMLRNLKEYKPAQKISIVAFSVCAIAGAVLQIGFFPDVLLTMFTLSLGLIIVLFSLETPDYQKLMDSMAELEKAKIEAEEAKKRAEIANQAKSTFLAHMSHEIRTPINAVLGMNEMILRESTDEGILNYADNIQSASKGLLSLINDLLDISKIESGKMDLIMAEYSLFGLLKDCYNMSKVQMREKNLEFTIENETKIPDLLYGDGVRIRQILYNLLTNACKYTEVGKVTMRVKHRRISDDEIILIISVEDTGRGISEENQKRLFETFERFEERRNRHIEGVGLGLAITKDLVELMQGEIGVESKEGEGSLFFVEIPQQVVSGEKVGNFYERYEETFDEKKHLDNWSVKEGRLLVVDDVKTNLLIVENLLKHTGIEIDTASSGAECLEKTAQKAYHVILLDHMMPEMDGIETLQQLKKQQGMNKNTPVIMSTANAIIGAQKEYLEAGFDDYLSKPASGKELEAVILKYLPEELVERKIQ